MIQILGISGSLRRQSSNTLLLHALVPLLPPGARLQVFDGIGELPHFNPDLDQKEKILSVEKFREALAHADAVLISTPEYAFGMPGVLKNALDWVVSSGELNEKPVAAISASPLHTGGNKAMASLLPTLTALGTHWSEGSTHSIPVVYKKMTGTEITDPQTREKLQAVLETLCAKVRRKGS